MKVYVYAADQTGCGHYRMAWPAQVARAMGVDVTLSPIKQGIPIHADGDRVVAAAIPRDADVVVFQRMTQLRMHQVPAIYRKAGVAVVVDMDDDLSCIDPANPAFGALRPGNPTGQSWLHAQKACDDATLVTVSTPALLRRYAKHGRGRVLRNCVPSRYLTLATQRRDSDRVGWAGATFSHPQDLQVMGDAIAQLGGPFQVVGPADGVADALRLPSDSIEASGPVSIGVWPAVIAAGLGIGVAPLADTRFNEAKSWLKPLEYAAVGVPCVMSPRVEYRWAHEQGIGLLAKRPRDWLQQLRRLQASSSMRQDLAAQGLQVASRWTIEGRIEQWIDAWSEALRIQRGARPPAKVIA